MTAVRLPAGPREPPRGALHRAPAPARLAAGTPLMTLTRVAARLLTRGLCRLRVTGLENLPASGAVLLALNHTALVDGPIVYGALPRPTVFMVKAEAFVGLVGRTLRAIGQIPVRAAIAERAPVRSALAVLAAGGVVGVFPEGGRGAGEIGPVQHGVAYLALRAGCPVLPVACLGTADVLPPGHVVPRPGRTVRIVLGPPVPLADLAAGGRAAGSRRTVTRAADRVRDALARHVAATRSTGRPVPAPRPPAGSPSERAADPAVEPEDPSR